MSSEDIEYLCRLIIAINPNNKNYKDFEIENFKKVQIMNIYFGRFLVQMFLKWLQDLHSFQSLSYFLAVFKRNTRYTEAEIAEWFSGFIEARLIVK